MDFGTFSLSLAVNDLQASKAFYKKLGFETGSDTEAEGWLIMKNDSVVIGLFQGMFEKNIMTFNPGWSEGFTAKADAMDIREIQKKLKAEGLQLSVEADETTTGPAHLVLEDPDGNQIMLDQHV
ncbi:MAG: VOC family protein [Pseudomonadota bacterium]